MFQAVDLRWYPLCNSERCNCSSRRRVMMMLASSACARSCAGFVGFFFCARGRTTCGFIVIEWNGGLMAGVCRTHSGSAFRNAWKYIVPEIDESNELIISNTTNWWINTSWHTFIPSQTTIAWMEVPHGGAQRLNDNGPGSTGENLELTVRPLEAPSGWKEWPWSKVCVAVGLVISSIPWRKLKSHSWLLSVQMMQKNVWLSLYRESLRLWRMVHFRVMRL